jgi:hypothetical protein
MIQKIYATYLEFHSYTSRQKNSTFCTRLTETQYVLRDSHGRFRDDNPTRLKTLCWESLVTEGRNSINRHSGVYQACCQLHFSFARTVLLSQRFCSCSNAELATALHCFTRAGACYVVTSQAKWARIIKQQRFSEVPAGKLCVKYFHHW